MQSRGPRLDWIGKVLADPEEAAQRPSPARLRPLGVPAPAQSNTKRATKPAAPAVRERKPSGSGRPRRKSAR